MTMKTVILVLLIVLFFIALYMIFTTYTDLQKLNRFSEEIKHCDTVECYEAVARKHDQMDIFNAAKKTCDQN